MLNIDKIRNELGLLTSEQKDSMDYSIRIAVERWAINHFGRLPYMNQMTDRIYDRIDPTNVYFDEKPISIDNRLPIYDEDCGGEELREKRQNIDMEKTLRAIIREYPDTIEYHYKAGKLENAILFNEEFVYFDGVFYMDTPEIPERMYGCIVEKEETPRIRWVLRDGRGQVNTRYMDILPKGEIEGNYNDDFMPVNEKVQGLIHGDESCIIILHGKPGTGKTSYIRDLISMNQDVKFYWIDSSLFSYIDTSEFVEYIASCKNGVFILEDSEVLLTSRDEHHNPAMQSLLSISDGMLGDSLKLKFICTFNTELKNIDKAILRKGRMKIKYEFKDLAREKVAEIFRRQGIDESLAKDMPLCDVYNFLEDNGDTSSKPRKIGFACQ